MRSRHRRGRRRDQGGLLEIPADSGHEVGAAEALHAAVAEHRRHRGPLSSAIAD